MCLFLLFAVLRASPGVRYSMKPVPAGSYRSRSFSYQSCDMDVTESIFEEAYPGSVQPALTGLLGGRVPFSPTSGSQTCTPPTPTSLFKEGLMRSLQQAIPGAPLQRPHTVQGRRLAGRLKMSVQSLKQIRKPRSYN